jgi:hypothetical protein
MGAGAGMGFGRVNTSLNVNGARIPSKDDMSPATLAKLREFDAACNGHHRVGVLKDSSAGSSGGNGPGRRVGGFHVKKDTGSSTGPAANKSAATTSKSATAPKPRPPALVKASTSSSSGKLMKLLNNDG